MYFEEDSVSSNRNLYLSDQLFPRLNISPSPLQQLEQRAQLPKISQGQEAYPAENYRQRKTRAIIKHEKPVDSSSKKDRKRLKTVARGRPVNENIEYLHLKESKSYNDIIYHFARVLIFLKLREQRRGTSLTLHLTNKQSQWVSQTQSLMNIENFPEYNQRNITFLLHSNSLHFVFLQKKKTQKRMSYCSEQVKCMFMAFLKKRNLLSHSILEYINDYWQDVIELVNNPNGEPSIDIGYKNDDRSEIDSADILRIQHPSIDNSNNNQQQSQRMIYKNSSQGKEGKKGKNLSEIERLKFEIKEDPTILAYEIACYLHACSIKFWFQIYQSK